MYTLIIKHTDEGYVLMPEFETYERAIEVAQSTFYCYSKGVSIELLHPKTEEFSGRKFETLRRKDFNA